MKMIEVDREVLQRLEDEIQHCEGNLASAKEEVKSTKEDLDQALGALRVYVRELVNPTTLPLLDGTMDVVDPKTGEVFS